MAAVGGGGVDLSMVQGAAISGAQPIIALDLWQSSLDLAMELGATHTINASTEDGTRGIRELTGGKGVAFAFEASGNPYPISQAYRSIHEAGPAVWVWLPLAGAQRPFRGLRSGRAPGGANVRPLTARIPHCYIPDARDPQHAAPLRRRKAAAARQEDDQ